MQGESYRTQRGAYTGPITIAGIAGAPAPFKNIAVTLVISSPPPTLVASPTAVNFSYIIGNPIPDPSLASLFVLASNGTPLSATIAATTTPWLKVSPTGNISLAGLLDFTITVNPSGLLPKVYTATVTINAPSAANKTLTIAVTLTVNAAVPQALGTFPVGLIPGSAQSIVTLLGTGFYAKSTVAATGFTPTATITVTDSAGTPATETLGIPAYTLGSTILRIPLASTLPSGIQNIFYAQALPAAGGTAPYTWGLSSGALPPGISVVGSALAGTPIAPASYNFTLRLTDSAALSQPLRTSVQAHYLSDRFDCAGDHRVSRSASSGQVATAYKNHRFGRTPPYLERGRSSAWHRVERRRSLKRGAGVGGPDGPLAAAQVSTTALLVAVPPRT